MCVCGFMYVLFVCSYATSVVNKNRQMSQNLKNNNIQNVLCIQSTHSIQVVSSVTYRRRILFVQIREVKLSRGTELKC